jgi:hypothetical protein
MCILTCFARGGGITIYKAVHSVGYRHLLKETRDGGNIFFLFGYSGAAPAERFIELSVWSIQCTTFMSRRRDHRSTNSDLH